MPKQFNQHATEPELNSSVKPNDEVLQLNPLAQSNTEVMQLDISSEMASHPQKKRESLIGYCKAYQKYYWSANESIRNNYFKHYRLIETALKNFREVSSDGQAHQLQTNPELDDLLELNTEIQQKLAIAWHKADLKSHNFKNIYRLYFHHLDTRAWSEKERLILAAFAAAREVHYLELVRLNDTQRAVIVSLFHQDKAIVLPIIEKFSFNAYLQQIKQKVFTPLTEKIAKLSLKAASGDDKAGRKVEHLSQLQQQLEQQIVAHIAEANTQELEAYKASRIEESQAFQNHTGKALEEALENLQKSSARARKARESGFESALKKGLTSSLNSFAERAEVHADLGQVRNYLAYYCKYLAGVLLAIPLAGLPAISEGYRQTFFSTRSEKLVSGLQERIENTPVSTQTSPPKC